MSEKVQNENPRVGKGEQNKSSDIQGKRASVRIGGPGTRDKSDKPDKGKRKK
jgi:hypothetical protein